GGVVFVDGGGCGAAVRGQHGGRGDGRGRGGVLAHPRAGRAGDDVGGGGAEYGVGVRRALDRLRRVSGPPPRGVRNGVSTVAEAKRRQSGDIAGTSRGQSGDSAET